MLGVLASFFILSFSSILAAGSLVLMTFFVLSFIYWNLFSTVPLYLFSLFMMGGLYVLIGFVMMVDVHDMDQVFTSKKSILSFLMVLFSFVFSFIGKNGSLMFDLDYIDTSVVKSESFGSSWWFSGTYLFLIFYLLVFLFIIHVMMKSSWGKGGFMNIS